MIVKAKDNDKSKAFRGCDPKHKDGLVNIMYNYDEVFQEPPGLPPRIKIQHEIQLKQDAPLPNIGMYRLSVLDNEEINMQVWELFEK